MKKQLYTLLTIIFGFIFCLFFIGSYISYFVIMTKIGGNVGMIMATFFPLGLTLLGLCDVIIGLIIFLPHILIGIKTGYLNELLD